MKKALSLALSFLMIMTTLTALPFYAAGDTAVSQVSLTLDEEGLILNTAYTEGEVNARVAAHIGTAGDGYAIDSAGLRYKPADSWYGIGNGQTQVQSDRAYGIEYLLELKDGFEWLNDVKAFTNQTAITECPAFTLNVNGIKRTDVTIQYNDYWNELTVWVPLGNASATPIITGIAIEGSDIALGVGESYTFVATITGTADDKTINWSVEGAASAATVITSGGVLTVGADETAETLIVKAASNYDSTQFSQKTVTVLAEAATIESVTVSPKNITLKQKSAYTFTATVEGTQTDKSVIWTVDGATSAGTAISDKGVLTVDVDETAATLTVKATAVQDNTKFDTATVTVQALARINTVSLTYNANNIKLTTADTEGAVNTRVISNTGCTGEDYAIGRTHLMYKPEDSWYGIGNGQTQVQSDRKYGIEYTLELKDEDNFDWIKDVKAFTAQTAITECPALTVNVNGKNRTDVTIQYNDYWNYLIITVPIAFYHTHSYDAGKITKTTATTYTKTFTCKGCGKTYQKTYNKKANTLTVKAKAPRIKYAKLKKANQTILRKNALTYSKAVGTVTYAKASGNSKITVNKTTGKITVKKGLKKGTYTVKIKVTAAGNKTTKKVTKTVTVKIKVY